MLRRISQMVRLGAGNERPLAAQQLWRPDKPAHRSCASEGTRARPPCMAGPHKMKRLIAPTRSARKRSTHLSCRRRRGAERRADSPSTCVRGASRDPMTGAWSTPSQIRAHSYNETSRLARHVLRPECQDCSHARTDPSSYRRANACHTRTFWKGAKRTMYAVHTG